MARGPREPGQAEQAKFRHRGALWKLSTPSLQVPGWVWCLFRICDLGGKPKPCLPTPGDSMPWALTGAVLRAKLPRLTGCVGSITKGSGQGILELRSPGEKMRSWKGYGLTDPVIHSFSKHS